MPVPGSAAEEVHAGSDVITRVFEAPLELVFEVWTKVEHFERWFGPLGVEVVDCQLEARPGGILRFGHRFPDGPTFRVKGTFHEVVQNERLVFTTGFVDDDGRPRRHPMFPDWPAETVMWTAVVFSKVDRGTRVTVTQRVSPPEVASHPVVKRHQELALEGWKQVLTRLGEHLSMQPDTRGHRA